MREARLPRVLGDAPEIVDPRELLVDDPEPPAGEVWLGPLPLRGGQSWSAQPRAHRLPRVRKISRAWPTRPFS